MLEMQLLETGSIDCPLIRIAGVDAAGYELLHSQIELLANGELVRLEISQIDIVSSPDGCHLTAVAYDWNQGVIRCDAKNVFEWRLTRGTWDNVAGLLEPFCQSEPSDGYQWLESAGDIRVLVTTNGTW